MDKRIAKISGIISKVSELQVLKMAYSVYLHTYGAMGFNEDPDMIDEGKNEALDKIDEINNIMERAQASVEKRIRVIDKSWESKLSEMGSFTVYLQSLGANVEIIDEDRQKDISFNVLGIPMTVDEMLEVVGEA